MSLIVTSREYKVMLNTGRFEDREAGCEAIWELIDFLARRQASLTGGVAIEKTLKDGKPDDELREVTTPDIEVDLSGVHPGGIQRARHQTGKAQHGRADLARTLVYFLFRHLPAPTDYPLGAGIDDRQGGSELVRHHRHEQEPENVDGLGSKGTGQRHRGGRQ